MSSAEQQTIVVIGLSGAGLKTINLLLDRLYSRSGQPKTPDQRIRLIAIEKATYAYWPPGSLRASVVDGFEDKIIRSFDYIIPQKIQDNHPDLVKVFTGTEVVDLDLKERFLVFDKPLDGLGVEPGNKLVFDYLIIASGSSYAFPCRPPPEAGRPEELKAQLRSLQEQIRESQSILIVGAGAVGIELAGEVSSKHKDKSITLVCSTPSLLPDMNPKLGNSLKQQLTDRKVKIVFGSRANIGELGISKTGKLDKLTKIGLATRDGDKSSEDVEADFVFLAIGNKPNTKFVPAEYLEPESRLIKVNEHLQVLGEDSKPIDRVYGVGDAINFRESKLYAALDGQAATVSKNLWIDISDSKLDKGIHKPLKDTIAIPLGPCGGASEVFGFTFGLGPWATSLAKGYTLLLWMFNSLNTGEYHSKDLSLQESTEEDQAELIDTDAEQAGSLELIHKPKQEEIDLPEEDTTCDSKPPIEQQQESLRSTPTHTNLIKHEDPSEQSTPDYHQHQTSLTSPESDVLDDSLVYQHESPIQSPTLNHPDRPDHEPLNKNRSGSTSISPSFSLWEHLKYEISSNQDELSSLQDSTSASLRSERISNFLNVPIAIEKTIVFGFWICLDAFLSVLTILPIKFIYSLYKLLESIVYKIAHSARTVKNKLLGRRGSNDRKNHHHRKRLSVPRKVDLLQGLLIILVCVFLHHVTDASRMYHSVRGQETIKLYVIFNVLEIADRLCCSFGQDILDSLFSPSTLGRRIDGSQPHMKPIFLFILAFIFTVAHTLVLFYQLVSLNVAINSFDHSLITLLISNQFVEIKGAVFKKFEKENLFQMSCADIVERFQLFLMLTIIAIRNLIEMSGSSTSSSHAHSYTYHYLPASLNLSPTLSLIEKIFTPVFVVMLSEVLVDWLKHAFITKFNHIRPGVYGRYIDVLCKDLVGDHKIIQVEDNVKDDEDMKPFVDKSPAVSRRLGFSVFPIFCLSVRVSFQAIDMLSDTPDEDFNVFTDDLKDILFDRPNKFTVEYVKQQFFIIPYSKFFNADPAGYLDPLEQDRSPPSRPPEVTGSSTFSSFQMKGFIVLSFVVVMSFLILIKLYIGIRIRLYAIKRVQTMNNRLAEDQVNGRDRMPIGLSPTEIMKEENDRKLIEKVEFDVPLRTNSSRPNSNSNQTLTNQKAAGPQLRKTPSGLHLAASPSFHHLASEPPSHSPDQSSSHHKKKLLSMDELSRFDMVRSRIW
ncbi:hypothetical protein PtA15_3A904 [Puccinia triticina]|uniref:FAD/NAD(P)-binding domain-containing protein n=1 Tax=Puccinia triticina TaxID=208348 RepID=A0ABY7CGN9_9BASI|nr:uncharacterized protein PtA15_3A904 [Puccinia triticina]WAQ83533.1 hypothetical protein PtA15_3A904 [Puccinia triticina]